MADQSDRPGLGGRFLRAVPCVIAHGLCLLVLFVLLWVGGGEWSRAANEVLMERSPATDLLLGLISLIVQHSSVILVLMSVLLLIDLIPLIRLDRSGRRRIGRELWSGSLFVAIAATAFLAADVFSGDVSRHFNNLNRGRNVNRQQEERRLDQLAGVWKLVAEEHNGEPITPAKLQDGRFVVETREDSEELRAGMLKTATKYNPPSRNVTLRTGGEDRHGSITVNISMWPPEMISFRYEGGSLQQGIFRLKNDRLELCVAPADTFPPMKDFSTAGNANTLYVFEREESLPEDQR